MNVIAFFPIISEILGTQNILTEGIITGSILIERIRTGDSGNATCHLVIKKIIPWALLTRNIWGEPME